MRVGKKVGVRLPAALLICVGVSVAGAGCGDGQADGPTVTQRVTEQFGRELIEAQDDAPLVGHGTVARLLREYHDVAFSDSGYAVRAVDGRRANQSLANEQSWVLNVNGIEADEWPSRYRLYDGDVVQWDLRDWYVTFDVRATVGAFPQTFTRGVFGKRFPVTVECEMPRSEPCRRVVRTLNDAGVATDGSRPPGGRPPRGQPRRAKVLVGRWEHWRDRPWPRRVDRGPRYSGIFARFAPDGRSLRLLNWDGRRVRSEDSGTGLVGAMRPSEADLMWLVTGVDDEGVARAARALDSDSLRDAFAVAVTADGVEKLPLPAPPVPEAVDPRDVDVAPYQRAAREAPAIRPSGVPGGFAVEDVVRGDGASAGAGTTVVVNYAGHVYSGGRWKPYNSSYGDGRPVVFTIDRGGVIEGFSRAVRGMRVGGRRTVVIPPSLGYGDAGDPPTVGPRDILMFTLDLEAIPTPDGD